MTSNPVADKPRTVTLYNSIPIPQSAWLLFLVFSVYLVIPIIDLPILGLSISAPLLGLVFLEIFIQPRSDRLRISNQWIAIGYFFWVSLLISLAGNVVFHNIEITGEDFLTLLRYLYWLVAFFTCTVVVSSVKTLRYLGLTIAFSLAILAGMRLYEAILWGKWGAWTGVQILSQNTYGLQFSTFFPFAFALSLMMRHRVRILYNFIIIIIVTAIAINGSRSSWIAVSISLLLFIIIFVSTQRQGIWIVPSRSFIFVLIFIILFSAAPENLTEPIISRFNTFYSVEEDKSYEIRQLMIQKGQRLFSANPVLGVGIGHFRDATVPLDIPDVLSYAGQEHFDRKSPHNSYIALLAETGLIGIMPFIIIHILLFFRGLKATIILAKRNEVWAIAIFTSYLGMSIHLWSLSGLTSTTPWFVYGLVAGIIERSRRIAVAR